MKYKPITIYRREKDSIGSKFELKFYNKVR